MTEDSDIEKATFCSWSRESKFDPTIETTFEASISLYFILEITELSSRVPTCD